MEPLDRGASPGADAAHPQDAARPPDAARDAARPPDAGALDAGAPGADASDADPQDARPRDATLADAAAVFDGGSPDVRVPDAAVCREEGCTGRDDDCDGRVDEGAACVPRARADCRLWVGFAAAGSAPAGPAWGACPGVEADRGGAQPCASSRGSGRFYSVPFGAAPGAGDRLGVAWTCAGEDAAFARWAQGHCAVEVAIGKGSLDCADAQVACARTTADGAFVPLILPGPLDGDVAVGVGFSCEDEGLPDRAAGVGAGLTAWIATQYRHEGADGCLDEDLFDDSDVWGACPGLAVDAEGRHRCASSAGDGALHGFTLGAGGEPTLGPCSGVGVALR
ncbi:MAG: hypothetical protein R3F60_21200 [bacterium]